MANAPSRPRPINGAGAPWCPHPKTDGQGTANAGIAMKQSHVANVNIFIRTTREASFAVSGARLCEFRMPSSGPYGLTLTAYLRLSHVFEHGAVLRAATVDMGRGAIAHGQMDPIVSGDYCAQTESGAHLPFLSVPPGISRFTASTAK
jgi:hypothetical protein